MGTKRTILTVLVALMLVTAGCSGAGDGAAPEGGDGGDAADAADAPRDDAESEGMSADDTSNQAGARRQLIRTGRMELRVEDFGTADTEVRAVAESHGGFVSDFSQHTAERHNETWTRGTIVVRVPGDSFQAAVSDLRGVGEVRNVETSTNDVTDQLVDIEARLENLRAERDRLRTLYDEANETEDVLAVQSELARVQEEIERLEAQQRRLEERVAYATITVRLAEPQPEPEEPQEQDPAWYETGVVTAFLESVSGVATLLRAAVVGAAYLAPYLLVLGTPVIGAAALYRARGRFGDFGR